jgi:hypothetical protein
MNMKKIVFLLGLIVVGMSAMTTFAGVKAGGGSSLAIYSGSTNAGWISQEATDANTEVIMNDARIKKLFGNITNFKDKDATGEGSALATWAKTNTGDGKPDVIITACGTMPSSLYPFPNKKPDGSIVEEFVDAGNVLINVADWIGYMSYEGGVRSPNNGPSGAANIFDIKGLSFGARKGDMKPTDAGKKYIPSIKPFKSDRPWHAEQFKGTDWDLTIFAQADADNADPAVAVSKKAGKDGNGIIAAMWQAAKPAWPDKPDIRGIGVVEFIANWLDETAKLSTAVEAQDKLTTTWAGIKGQ